MHKMGCLVDAWLVSVVLVLLLLHSAMGAKSRHMNWEVGYVHWSPDGVEGVVMAINGQFPGPTIVAEAGDTIHLNLTNNLFTEGVVIHWHGIRQMGTPWADGTAAISQCAINPGETFLYRFKVDKAGTYFYHGHYGMQRSAGLYGSLIVKVGQGETESLAYDDEFNILLSDWWHKTAQEQEVDLSSRPMVWIGEPQSLLINGRGQFNCSLAAHFSNSSDVRPCNLTGGEQYAPHIIKVHPNKTYRLRIASSTSLAALNLAIGNHTMTVVEADGNYVEPFSVDNIDIYSGESYSILFTTNQNSSNNYYISVGVRGREPKTPQALTLLNYLPTSSSKLPISPPPLHPKWDDYDYSKSFSKKILAKAGSTKPPAKQDRRIIMLNTQNYLDGYTKWTINNVSLVLPRIPYLGAIKYNLTDAFDQKTPPGTFNETYDVTSPPPNPNTTSSTAVYRLQFNTVVDVILQNANTLTPNNSEIHPWHLHGHDFWVLGYGEIKFDAEKDMDKLNVDNPPYRNTVVIYPFGWTAIRFVADNPGAWPFHCHIEPHLHMGMGVVFVEGESRIGDIPDYARRCMA